RFSCRVAVGKRAITDIEVVEATDPRWSLIRCRLKTGRTHQIRVHLSEHTRTPPLADSLYGGSLRGPLAGVASRRGRPALRAARLARRRPGTGARVPSHSPRPGDLRAGREQLRALPRESGNRREAETELRRAGLPRLQRAAAGGSGASTSRARRNRPVRPTTRSRGAPTTCSRSRRSRPRQPLAPAAAG